MRKLVKQTGFYIFILFIILFSLFPFYWAVVSSLKNGNDLFLVEYLPKYVTLSNYIGVFSEQNFITSILNSIFVSTITVVLSLSLALFASYSLSRITFKGRKLFLYTVLSISMFPHIAVLSGMFELIRYFHLYNTLFSLTLSYMMLVLPFTVWVLTTFMQSIPKEIEEAAVMDGCSPIKIIFKIFLPLMKPALATTGLLAFIAAWNEFLFALTFTLTAEKRTVPVAIALLSGSSQYELPWGKIMAASVVVTLPLIILVLIFQKQIISGLTAGAVKG